MRHPPRANLMKRPTSSSHRLAVACALLAYCGLCCRAFITLPAVTTLESGASSLSLLRGWRARQHSRGTTSTAVRMQEQAGNDDELQVAVRTLAAQVEDLTALVRQLVAEPAGTGVGNVAAASASQNINGADVGGGVAVPVVPTKASKGGSAQLVNTSAAQERIDLWLQESGGGGTVASLPPVPPVPVVAAAPFVAEVVAVPVVPEVQVVPEVAAPPAEAAPADAAPVGSGYKVKIEWDGAIHDVTCDADTTVLDAAMDAGLELPHSCMSGSCLTCPGKLVSGTVDQSEGVLEDDQTEAGYLLTCVSYPKSDVHFAVIEEDDLP